MATVSKMILPRTDEQRQEAIDTALAEYASITEGGGILDREGFLSRYSEIRNDLEPLLAEIGMLNRLGMGMQAGPSGKNLASNLFLPGVAGTLGDFELVRRIGEGGVASVYEARQISLGRVVALKLFTGTARLDPEARERFVQEARIASSLVHDHVVPIHGMGWDDDHPFICMRWMEGGSLADKAGRLSPTEIARVGAQISKAVAHAHSLGILHRDIKPANILLDQSKHAFLADFGLAMASGSAGQATEGTLTYLSPERVENPSQPHGALEDVYAIGLSMLETALGSNPFVRESASATLAAITAGTFPAPEGTIPGFPEELAEVIQKAVATSPADRYQSAAALAEDLQRFLQGKAVQARPIPQIVRARRWLRRNRVLAGAVSIGVIVTLGVSGIWTLWREKVHLGNRSRVLEQAIQEQRRISELAAGTVKLTRSLRNIPGQSDRERVLLAQFRDNIRDTCSQLAADHPLRAEEALILSDLFTLERASGNGRSAEQLLFQAKAALQEVIPYHPGRIDLPRELALILENEANSHAEIQPEKAVELCDQARVWIDRGLEQKPDSGSLQDRAIWLAMVKVRALAEMGKTTEAEACLRDALSQCEELLGRYPTGHPLSYSRPAVVCLNLARLHLRKKDPRAAEDAFRLARSYEIKLRDQFPELLRYKESTGEISLELVELLAREQRLDEARILIREEESPVLSYSKNFPDTKYSVDLVRKLRELQKILGVKPSA